MLRFDMALEPKEVFHELERRYPKVSGPLKIPGTRKIYFKIDGKSVMLKDARKLIGDVKLRKRPH